MEFGDGGEFPMIIAPRTMVSALTIRGDVLGASNFGSFILIKNKFWKDPRNLNKTTFGRHFHFFKRVVSIQKKCIETIGVFN